MAAAASLYGKVMYHLGRGEIAYQTDTIKCALVGSGYTFDQDNHETFADVVANEASGNGYTARGAALTTKTMSYTTADNRTHFFADNSFWTPAAGTSLSAYGAVLYKDTGTNSTSWLIGYVNFGVQITATGAPLTVDWSDTDGVFYLNV